MSKGWCHVDNSRNVSFTETLGVAVVRPFRSSRGRLVAPTQPPGTEAETAAYRDAWADYVAWSDLDEDRLPGELRPEDREQSHSGRTATTAGNAHATLETAERVPAEATRATCSTPARPWPWYWRTAAREPTRQHLYCHPRAERGGNRDRQPRRT